MRRLRAPNTLRPGLMLTGNLSRGEVCYWNRDRTGREARDPGPASVSPAGSMIEFIQNECFPMHRYRSRRMSEAHEVAQEYVATGRVPGKRDG